MPLVLRGVISRSKRSRKRRSAELLSRRTSRRPWFSSLLQRVDGSRAKHYALPAVCGNRTNETLNNRYLNNVIMNSTVKLNGSRFQFLGYRQLITRTVRQRQFFRRRQSHDPMLVLNMFAFNFATGWARTFNPIKSHENGAP